MSLPNPTTYAGIANTVVTGRTVFSNITGAGKRSVDMKTTGNTEVISIDAAVSPGTALSDEDLIRATRPAGLLINRAAAANSILTVGIDNATNAAHLVSLFNLQSTSDKRILRFTAANQNANNCALAVASGSAALVTISLDGASATTTQSLFIGTNAVGATQSGIQGTTRIVVVSASNITEGSEVVNFNVLSRSV